MAPTSCPHNDAGYACFECETLAHALAHPDYVDGCYTCKLQTLRFDGRFHGPGNVSSKAIDHFWNTGEAEVFDRQKAARRLAREDRRTKLDRVKETA